jgi:hypothetical protein
MRLAPDGACCFQPSRSGFGQRHRPAAQIGTEHRDFDLSGQDGKVLAHGTSTLKVLGIEGFFSPGIMPGR